MCGHNSIFIQHTVK